MAPPPARAAGKLTGPKDAPPSARVTTEPNAAPLDSLSATLAKLGAINPDVENTPVAECKDADKNTPAEHSGSGYDLPAIDGVRWEDNPSGGFEAWHAPEGAIHRREKTYLGYLGKRQLAKWGRESPAEFQRLVCDWIAAKRDEKGIR